MNCFFSAATVADVLSVSKKNILTWTKNGKLVPELDPLENEKPYSQKQLEKFPEFQKIFDSNWNENISIRPKNNYNLIELFAGAGGLALGLERAGFESILLNEIEKDPCNTLRTNRPQWNVIEDDISNICFKSFYKKVDLLTGGFPCQPFSYAGKKKGFNDIRGTLIFEMIRALREIRPKIFLAENVKGLLKNNNGNTLKSIIKLIEESGYNIIENNIYKTMFYKVPQKRERLILIGIRNDLYNKAVYHMPPPYTEILSVKDALLKGKLYSTDVPISDGQTYPKRKKEIMDLIPEGGYWRDLPINLQKEYMKKSFFLGGGKTGVARRLSWNEPSLTLTCAPAQKQTERCHPSESRPLSIREYARIQTFPDDWIFTGSLNQIYKQIGNAVPVNFATAIGKSIVRLLNDLG